MKNNILKGFTIAMICMFLLAWIKIDTPSIIPKVISLLSAGWIGLFVYVNVFRYSKELEVSVENETDGNIVYVIKKSNKKEN